MEFQDILVILTLSFNYPFDFNVTTLAKISVPKNKNVNNAIPLIDLLNTNKPIRDCAQNAANAWLNSLNEDEENWTFNGLDGMDNLIPLWDLVEDADRAELMQEYFESGQYADDVTTSPLYIFKIYVLLIDLSILAETLSAAE